LVQTACRYTSAEFTPLLLNLPEPAGRQQQETGFLVQGELAHHPNHAGQRVRPATSDAIDLIWRPTKRGHQLALYGGADFASLKAS
jgi:hypothetical protein